MWLVYKRSDTDLCYSAWVFSLMILSLSSFLASYISWFYRASTCLCNSFSCLFSTASCYKYINKNYHSYLFFNNDLCPNFGKSLLSDLLEWLSSLVQILLSLLNLFFVVHEHRHILSHINEIKVFCYLKMPLSIRLNHGWVLLDVSDALVRKMRLSFKSWYSILEGLYFILWS